MGLIKEFKEFALKGNVVQLAIAVIIGAAFGAIVSSLVDDVITPMLLTPALKAAKAGEKRTHQITEVYTLECFSNFKTPELYQDVDDAEYERQLLKAQTFVEDDGSIHFRSYLSST